MSKHCSLRPLLSTHIYAGIFLSYLLNYNHEFTEAGSAYVVS
jgi:hypothetical protein